MRKLSPRICFALSLLTLSTVLPAAAATVTVTSLQDDGSPGTLRYAIGNANAGDTINFGVNGTITLNQGQLEINKNLIVTGPGAASLAISGANTSRVFQIDSGVTVSISDLTLQNGNGATGPTCNGGSIPSAVCGGGVYNGGSLMISNCILSANAAGHGGGIANAGSLTVISSTVSGNGVAGNGAGYGGGIFNSGSLTLTSTTVSGNSAASGGGGGIANIGGTLMVIYSTFSSNSARFDGGGIMNYNYATATLTNSTFFGNSVSSPFGIGGGFDNEFAAAMVTNSTFSDNSAAVGGGVFANSYAGILTLKNTLLANQISGGNCAATTISSVGYNLSDDNSCGGFFTATGDMNNTPAGLDPNGLQNNGGPTPTIAILPTSPAFNVIPLSPTNYCTDVSGNVVATDQRGVSRPQVDHCSIGAFEYSSDDDSGLAQVSSANNFTGNQTVSGNVTVTGTGNSFVGNGSGLTNVTASAISCLGCIGNTQLGINYAASSSQGGDASNSLKLEGHSASYFQPSGSYATTGANIFSGDQSIFGGLSLNSTGTATSSQGFPSNPLDAISSIYSSSSGTPQSHRFRWQAEPVVGSNNTASPKSRLSLLFDSNGTPAETGLSVNSDGTVNFVATQTFPGAGSGTITGVTAGTGLSGGGTSGSVTLNNTGILSITAGSGLSTTIGQTPTLSLDTTVTDARYLKLSGGTLTGNLTVSANESVSGTASVAGSTTLGGGTPILKHLSATLPASFAALNPAACASATLNINGAADGDTVALGVPNAFVTAGTSGGAVLDFFAWVNTANQVTIRECNIGSGKQKSTASGTIRVDVWKH